ncbi:transposase [Azospirillaceae bacterium]
MSVDKSEVIKGQILQLVSKLPAAAVREIVDVIGGNDGGGSEKAKIVRQSVIEYLNRLRPHRARRLFTDLFDPFLNSDDNLFRCKNSVYGVVLRADVGGLWTGLSRYAFPDLIEEIQTRLDDMSKENLLERVLISPEAMEFRERMRVAAVRFLDALSADRDLFNQFVQTVNRERKRDAKTKTMFLERLYNIDEPFIRMIVDILTYQPLYSDFIKRGLRSIPVGDNSDDYEKLTEQVLEATEELRKIMADERIHSRYYFMLPLSVIHVKRRYDVGGLYLRHIGIDLGRVGGLMVEAMMIHFQTCCHMISEILTGSLKLNDRVPGSAIKLTVKEKARIDSEMVRLNQLLSAQTIGGILENRRTEPQFRMLWIELSKFLSYKVTIVAHERLSVSILSRAQPTFDHDDMLWLLEMLWGWHKIARRFDIANFDMEKWREQVLGDMRIALEKALKFEENDKLYDRMGHILRLHQVLAVFDRRIMQFISPSSHNVTQMILDSLQRAGEMRKHEAELIAEFISLARSELEKSRYWKSPELSEVIKIAERRGF